MVTTLKYGSGKDSIAKLLKRVSGNAERGVKTKKYSGMVKLKEDPVKLQKGMRDEWQ